MVETKYENVYFDRLVWGRIPDFVVETKYWDFLIIFSGLVKDTRLPGRN